MKILCVADHRDALVYSNNIKSRFSDIELVLGAGDLPLSYYSFIVSSLNKPLLFVFGNHNLKFLGRYRKNVELKLTKEERKTYHGATYVGGRCKKVKNVLVVGLGGSYRYNKGLNQFTEAGMFFQILKLVPRLFWNRMVHGRYLDILLTHASPFGIHDKPDLCHRGFKVFLKFMDWFSPRYLIHGHIHLYNLNAKRKTQYKKTTVLNVYDHQTIEVDNEFCRRTGEGRL